MPDPNVPVEDLVGVIKPPDELTGSPTKLLLHADPGAIITEPIRRWCEDTFKNLTSVSVGPGIHFIQEDNPDGIGQAIAAWFVECLGSYPD
jgi:haloalkane dehalogenase